EDQLRRTQEALQRRARLARQMAATYQSLEDLSSYDASGAVSSSFDNLGQAISGMPPLKGFTAATMPIDPSQVLSKGAGMLAGWKQSRDLRKGVSGLAQTVKDLNDLFSKELPACQSIAEEYVEKS